MAADLGTGLGALGLLMGFPMLLLGVMWVLGWLEAWMLVPDERAAKIEELLQREHAVEEVELAVARMVAEATDEPTPGPALQESAG